MPGAVGAHLAVLAHDAELDREPEHVGEELQRLVGLHALGGQPGLALDLGEARRGEQVAVADHLVDEVGLGRVERHAPVADVLRRVEHAVAERAVELFERDEPGGRQVAKPVSGSRPARDLVELRDAVARAAPARPRPRGSRGRRSARAWARARGRRCARPRARPRCSRSRGIGVAGLPAPSRRRRSRCAARGSRDRWRPGWSSASWTTTLPSSSAVTGE